MAEAPAGVLVAGYPDTAGATKDFGSPGGLVRDTQALDRRRDPGDARPRGRVAVRQTCGNLGREGLGRGGGAGLAVGLFAPPLLAPVAAGAVAGGVIVEFAGHRAGQDIQGHSDS